MISEKDGGSGIGVQQQSGGLQQISTGLAGQVGGGYVKLFLPM